MSTKIKPELIKRANQIYSKTPLQLQSDDLKYIKRRFFQKKSTIKNGCSCFNGDINDFIEWWISDKHNGETTRDRSGHKKCYYCGISEKDLNTIYTKKLLKKGSKPKFISASKKANWNNSNLEIDKLYPEKGYTKSNCVFACHLCNNAKSDIIDADDFKNIIAPSIKKYYKYLLK